MCESVHSSCTATTNKEDCIFLRRIHSITYYQPAHTHHTHTHTHTTHAHTAVAANSSDTHSLGEPASEYLASSLKNVVCREVMDVVV